MKVQLIRHATLRVTYAGRVFLVDPMLSDAGVNPPIPNTKNERRNPLVPLQVPLSHVLDVDAYLVTHTHQDHFDEAAVKYLDKTKPLFCQPPDVRKFEEWGFQEVRPVEEAFLWKRVRISRTDGQHGTFEIGAAMGPVSGFVLQAEGVPTLYIAGDTIWCQEVRDAFDRYQPDVTVVNAGGARFLQGDPITMTEADLDQLCRHSLQTQVVAIHLDAINHCLETRRDLRAAISARQLTERVLIPEDGESLAF